MKNATSNALQLLPCRRCSLDWYHLAFSLYFYTIFFSPSPPKPCGYSTCLIMVQHVSSSPSLSAFAWHVLRYVSRDLRKWRKWTFPSLGWWCWGWVYNNQNQNEYQMAEPCGYCTCLIMMQHVQFSPNLYTTALTVLRNVPRNLQARRTCKLAAGGRFVCRLNNGNWKIINKHCISWNMLQIYLNLT
jgi:hypothetical protein